MCKFQLALIEAATMRMPRRDDSVCFQSLVLKLNDRSWMVRMLAVHEMAKLEPATLAQCAADVVARLEGDHEGVRCTALNTLRELEPAVLAQHAGAVVARLKDSDWDVCCAAFEALRTLEPPTLAQHSNVLCRNARGRIQSARAPGGIMDAALA